MTTLEDCPSEEGEKICKLKFGVVTGQYRRLLSACIVRAQAQCLISRIGVISPEARVAAQRREVAGQLERELREERQA